MQRDMAQQCAVSFHPYLRLSPAGILAAARRVLREYFDREG
jgi:hypothetical protein